MTDSLLAVTVIWGFVFIYAFMGSMDFGAGFWSMVYINRKKPNATNIANRYLSPTWEVTNTFIVAIVVAIYSFFPGAAFTFGTVLLIPGSIILLLLSIRSAFMVFSHIADDYRKILTYISGITGVLIPGFLISVLPVSHGGFVDFENNQQLKLVELFTSPNEYAFLGFGIASTLFLSSLLLADYSKASDDMEAYEVYRRDALITGPISLIMAFLIMITLKNEALWLYEGMIEKLPLLLLSLLFFLAGLGLVIKDRKGQRGMPRLSMISITLQYMLASLVYGQAHLPYLIYPEVTITSGFTDPNSFKAVFTTYIFGFAILFPGFIFFWSLFMNDKRYLKGRTKKH
ncbi:membrane protein [Bacillus coahuilensis m2-6]|uniref:cytochrome d ubiquinol oxidase subunit II n=1 Tax=Bacillus coahuilensis TaxID=408580 RepID=UPI00075024F4|nr:cytochrome d ubiquinol oxidase subunit II [Bacillus coahuilensis]KUP06349.1 membrane protein [Bacillus coahuilensis m2-6]